MLLDRFPLQVVWRKPGMFGYARQHLRADFNFLMERLHEILVSRALQCNVGNP